MTAADRARPTATGDVAYSLLVEVAGEPDVEAATRHLAGHGLSVRTAPATPGRWCLTVGCSSEEAMPAAEEALRRYFGADLVACVDRVLAAHQGGKLRVVPSAALETAEDLAIVYTPGVGRVASRIAADPAAADTLTGRRNTIAVVTDGSAVLGLGAVGPLAALPVMEGKAALFARLAGINAVPLCLGTTDVDEIVSAVAALAPTFGGINLEDIAAPRCFSVEAQLQQRVSIPVFHDDQHGTAVVVLAALRGALRLMGKPLETARIVIAGAGAAGTAVARFLLTAGATDVVVWSRQGILHPGDTALLPAHKRWLAAHTNPRGVRGGLPHALAGADVFVGVSGPGVLTRELVTTMAFDPVVFALANPIPEVFPDELEGSGAVVATGRSDYPNQINNVLAFPGIFRGALDAGATRITETMKMAAADALADLVAPRLSRQCLLPDPFDPAVVPAVASAVAVATTAADRAGVPTVPPVAG